VNKKAWRENKKATNVDVYMALLRQAKEKPISKFSRQEQQILNFIRKAPSYNELFCNSKKRKLKPDGLGKK